MKKLMKALAFATVACMLLSTAAFAEEVDPAIMDKGAKTVTVKVATNVASTPISIVVTPIEEDPENDPMTAEDINSGNILYINQGVTGEDGIATFENVDTKNTNGVNVFLGYEGVGDAALKLVAKALKLEPGDSVTIVPAKIYSAKDIDDAKTDVVAESDFGVGAVIDLTKADFGADRVIKDMIWSISYTKGGVADKAFTKVKPELIKAFNICNGSIRLGLTVSAGSKAADDTVDTAAEITDVDVIVKTNNAENTEEKIIFSDPTDANRKAE
jgi:opacity protein-like surface antigen